MGIKRLYQNLSCAFQPKRIEYLKNKRIGIDSLELIYRANFSNSDTEIMDEELKICIIRNIDSKIELLLKNSISPIFVIDGITLQCKKKRNLAKEKKLREFEKKALKMEKNNCDIGEIALIKKYSRTLTKEVIYFFIDYLIYKNLEFIIAPYEADSQLIYLYNKNEIDYIMSEDSDIAVYGCYNIIKGMNRSGDCFVLDEKILEDLKKRNNLKKFKDEKIEKALKFLEMKKEDKILFGIYSGCDYLNNIKGISFNKILKFFPDKIGDFKKYLKQNIDILKKKDLHEKSDEIKPNYDDYFKCVEMTKCTFNNMIVYDRNSKKLVHLNKLDPDLKKNPNIDFYVGDKNEFKKINLNDYITGKIDLKSFKKRNLEKHDFERMIKFIKNVTNPTTYFLNNLSTVTYSYKNMEYFIKN
jgi:exonuclease-1